ncbi:BASIC HELIX LOOP HELIX 68, PERICYCLE FACTOR TYPE-A 3 [Hibiscus trionum]|uniref:BASIC HELIX LOOP HELIX 68, PERICYCLE FACTOR TYPE-A 3 n=1 Tax=Hibiscus trionum TaxID=183268 RepID=A0A9W7MBY1_HIBTR|nr:BASIC HELIX LOOP HELIX 68, PERICYCLE FACTOR TYPE-A 3 [Hibiscus trionum]
MNRGLLQMMAGNTNWWNTNTMRPPTRHHQEPAASPFLHPTTTFFPHTSTPSSSSSSSSSSLRVPSWHDNQELPESWSQLLLGGLVEEEDKGLQALHLHQVSNANSVVDVKQENSASSYVYGHANEDLHHNHATKPAWFHQISSAASSPKSSVTSFSSNMLDFSGNKADHPRQPPPDRSSECNSTETGGPLKKARVQPSATQSTLKVRKEKLGDRITSLHQLVSPFGKTDTASVLSEAIGYIRFLQSQIEALSLPYLGNGSANMRHQPSVSDCKEETNKDLRSRGLCLVPVSCTLEVWSGDNGADYWAPPPALGDRY